MAELIWESQDKTDHSMDHIKLIITEPSVTKSQASRRISQAGGGATGLQKDLCCLFRSEEA